jgi:transcriptional regulator with XRE-family HTH domain
MQYTQAMQRPKSLLKVTYKLFKKSGLSYRQIAAGACVDVNWVAKFAQGKIDDPGVKKIQKVHDFLIAYEEVRMSAIPAAESAA